MIACEDQIRQRIGWRSFRRNFGSHLDLVGRLGLRRGHGQRRRSHHLVPERRHPREVRVAAGSLCSSTRADLFALHKSSAGGAVESRHPCRLPPGDRLYRLNGGASPATERLGRPESGPVTAAIWELLRPLADRGQPVYTQWVGSRPLRAVRQWAGGRPRPGGQRPPAAWDPHRHRDRPEGRSEVCYRYMTEELAWQMVPFHHGEPTTGPGRGRGSPRRGGHTPAPGRPLELLGAVFTGSAVDRRLDVSGATTWSVLAARCRVCKEEASGSGGTHRAMLCSGARRRAGGASPAAPGTIDPEATDVGAADFRAQLSLLGYAPWWAIGEQQQQQGSKVRITVVCTFLSASCRCTGWVDLPFRCRNSMRPKAAGSSERTWRLHRCRFNAAEGRR